MSKQHTGWTCGCGTLHGETDDACPLCKERRSEVFKREVSESLGEPVPPEALTQERKPFYCRNNRLHGREHCTTIQCYECSTRGPLPEIVPKPDTVEIPKSLADALIAWRESWDRGAYARTVTEKREQALLAEIQKWKGILP